MGWIFHYGIGGDAEPVIVTFYLSGAPITKKRDNLDGSLLFLELVT